MDDNLTGRGLRLLTGTGQLVGAPALDLHGRGGRRPLGDGADEARQRRGHRLRRQAARVGDGLGLTFGVVGGRPEAEVNLREVRLWQAVREVGQPGGGLEEDGQHTGRQRVEGARVSHLPSPGQGPQMADHLE